MDRIKSLVKESPVWELAKHILPRYHRPLLSLGVAMTRAMIKRDPGSARALAQAYAAVAKLRLSENAFARALSACEAALARDPACAAAYCYRGDARLRCGARASALEDYRKSLGLGLPPERYDIHLALAEDLFAQTRIREGIRHCHEARRLRPDCGLQIGHILRGHYLTRASSAAEPALLEAAIECFEDALRRSETAGVWELLQSSYLMAGRHAQHQRALERFFELREREPAFLEFRKRHPDVVFLPWYTPRSIGMIGWIATFVKKKLMLDTGEKLVLCAPRELVVNPAFLSYFRPFIEVLETPEQLAAAAPEVAAGQLPLEWGLRFDGPPKWLETIKAEVNVRWEREKRPPLLRLSDEHRERGELAIGKLGLRTRDWWVCVHVRTPSYKRENSRSADTPRNAEIETYFDAIRLITERGGRVFRMGDPSMAPLPEMEGVFDYATSGLRSDWMDVFLCARSRFYIGTASGLSVVPNAFGVPSLLTNHMPILAASYLPNDAVLPRLLRGRSGKLLSFREMLREPFLCAVSQALYDGAGVEVVSNSSEELLGAVAEMLDSFGSSGTRRVPPKADRERRFDQILAEAGITISGRISEDFLRRHEDLL